MSRSSRLAAIACAFGFIFGSSAFAQSASVIDVSKCDPALVRETLNESSTSKLDFRMASLVTSEIWGELRKSYSAEAIIYGVPLGDSFAEYRTNREARRNSLNMSFSSEQAHSVARSTLSAAGAVIPGPEERDSWGIPRVAAI